MSAEPKAKYHIFEVQFRRGEDAVTSTQTTEPTQFGGGAAYLETFTYVDVDALTEADGVITDLRLMAAYVLTGDDVSRTYYSKVGVRFQGSTTVRWGATSSVTGTTPLDVFNDTDLIAHVADFTNGDCFFVFGLWKSAGAGTASSGNSSVTEPNLSAHLIVETKS